MVSEKLKIALVVNLYPPYIVGGNEILARDVTEALRARGHEVYILTGYGQDLPNDGYTHQILDLNLDRKTDIFLGGLPLTWQRVIQWHLFNYRSFKGVLTTLKRLQPDLVIAWNLYMASGAPLLAAKRLPYPLIAHPADKWLLYILNDIGQLVPANTPLQRAGLLIIRRIIQPMLRQFGKPDYILAVSDFIRKLHIAQGYAAAQSKATYLGVPTQKFVYQPHAFPQNEPWRLLFVGQLWEGKGAQVAIEAVHRLRQRGDLPPITLDIFGSGADGFVQYLRQLIVERQLTDVVRLHGFVTHERLLAEFHSHHLYLFCSIWDEPFSGGLLEAMATGIPTIATTAGGTPEAVTHEQNGLLIKPNDPDALGAAIVRLLGDPTLYERISRVGAASTRTTWTFDA